VDHDQSWSRWAATGGDERPGETARDEPDVNPPWERPSARVPVPPRPPEAGGASRENGRGGQTRDYDWRPAIEGSLPGTGLDEITGTGKIPAIAPLRPGDSAWSPGLRAPETSQRRRRDVEVDEQPSVQMRALRAGNLARATIIVTSALMISRVLGLLRTSFFAYVFGGVDKGAVADAYTYAFTLPDMIFTIVAGGALASAFIPVFAEYMVDKRDRAAAWKVASAALNLAIAVVTVVAVVVIIFAPALLKLVFHPLFVGPQCTGPSQPTCEGPIVVELTRIMLLQPIFLGGATIAVAILQARQSFVLPAIGQVIYTASLIAGIVLAQFQARLSGQPPRIEYAAWGVVAGAALQLVIQVPGLMRARMRYSLSLDLLHPGIREIFRLMLPRLLNAVMLYVSVIVNRFFLTLLTGGGSSGAAYGYVTAFTLIMLPQGVFGMAVSQAAFPTLAAFIAAGEWERMRAVVLRTIRSITYLAVPSALGMLLLAQPISSLILAHGSFDTALLPEIVNPLIFFSIGLTGLSLVEILTRSFYAVQDTRTPTQVSILQFVFSIGLSVVLLQPMGASGLALASSLAWTGEAVVLLLLLRPKLGGLDLRSLGGFFVNVLAASVAATLAARVVYMLMTLALPIVHTSTTETLHMAIRVLAAIATAAVLYFAASKFLGIDDAMPIERLTRRLLRRRT
jgi:putative peptidoglycan lipid II flippase